MKYLIIVVMCLLAATKMSFQSAFGKKSVKNTADSVFFNGMVFAFAALIFLPSASGCSYQVWIYSLFAAIFTVAFQLTYTKALATGNISLTVMIVNFNMVITTMISYFVYDEPISLLRISGIAITVISFVLSTEFKDEGKNEKKWFVLAITALITSALTATVQKIFGESQFGNQSRDFISCYYILSFVITIGVYIFFSKHGEKKTFKTDAKAILLAMAVGSSLAVFQAVYTYAIVNIDGTFLFPAYSGGTIIFSALSGVLIFKDSLSVKQTVSLLMGIIAVVLMNF